jgi:hypothetical protein
VTAMGKVIANAVMSVDGFIADTGDLHYRVSK